MLNIKNIIFIPVILSTSSACSIGNSWYFCGSHNTEDMIISFDEERVYSSDVVFPLSACSMNIKECFFTNFNYINPEKITSIDLAKVNFKYSIEKLSDIGYLVTTEDKNGIYKYKYNDGIIDLKITSKLGSDELNYKRCSMYQYYFRQF